MGKAKDKPAREKKKPKRKKDKPSGSCKVKYSKGLNEGGSIVVVL